MLQDTENPWKIFATQIGAKYQLSEEGTSLVTGTYLDYPFVLKIIFIQAAPKVNLFLTHLEVLLKNPTELRLKIYREGIIQKLTKLFGTQDIILNDRAFDKKYIVEGSHEEKIKQMLTQDIRAKLFELGEILLILDGTKFIYEQSGKIINIQKLKMILEMLIVMGERTNID